MQCPYCLEEIREEASVCKHCHRSLELFLPLFRRMRELESSVATLSQTLVEAHGRATAATSLSAVTPSPISTPRSAIYYGLWTLTVAAVLNTLYWYTFSPIDTLVLMSANSAALFTGFWMALKTPGRHLGSYAVFGAVVGPLIGLVIALIDKSFMSSEVQRARTSVDWLYMEGTYALDNLLSCALGGIVGDFLENILRRWRNDGGAVASISRRIRERHEAEGARLSFTMGMHRLLTAVTPLLTLLATLFSAAVFPRPAEKEATAKQEEEPRLVPYGEDAELQRQIDTLKARLDSIRAVPGTVPLDSLPKVDSAAQNPSGLMGSS